MHLQLWTIGKNHEEYVEQGINDFTKRTSNYFPVSWKLIPVPKNAGHLSGDELKKKEAEQVLKLLNDSDYLVLLDEKGRTFTSKQLSSFIQSRANESLKQLVFLIGGAYGVDKTVSDRANFTWSLSSLTFPHQLVRLILAEQVYRACTILRNEKYHHS
jgi:23S rRNA (pseudouridine1915-N3)-methyltransferase